VVAWCLQLSEYVVPVGPVELSAYAFQPLREDEEFILIERAVILSNNGVLPNPLPKSDKNRNTNPLSVSDKNPVTVTSSQGTFDGSTRALILRALQTAEWIIGGPSGAAARLGLKRATLIAKMKKLGISRPVRQVEVAGLSQNREPLIEVVR
jgi:formate hydrogenlyase transcriptional activator